VTAGSQTIRATPAIPTIAWLAAEDGIGHAQTAGGSRTMCDRPATLLRYAYPERTRCEPCAALVEVRKS
jgi:hypothetical protein